MPVIERGKEPLRERLRGHGLRTILTARDGERSSQVEARDRNARDIAAAPPAFGRSPRKEGDAEAGFDGAHDRIVARKLQGDREGRERCAELLFEQRGRPNPART